MNRSLLLLSGLLVTSCGGPTTNDFDGDGSADAVDCVPIPGSTAELRKTALMASTTTATAGRTVLMLTVWRSMSVNPEVMTTA